jgi:IMP dehydrogenase
VHKYGIITSCEDMTNINLPLGLSYDDVLLVPQYSEIDNRADVDLSVQLTPRIKLYLPITSSPMSDVTDEKFAIALGKLGGLGLLHRFNKISEEADMVAQIKKQKLPAAAAIGCREDYLERAEALVHAGVDALLLDVADGHMKKAIDTTRILKQKYGSKIDIMSGLVATKDGAMRLFEAGADCVHVGIGGGSICTTRINTGCGVPNITTILETATAARKFNKSIVVDAGIKSSGDIVKALAAGAHSVRCGYFLSGTKESPGLLRNVKGVQYKMYCGSTSSIEKKNHVKKKIVQSANYIYHVEGVNSMVPYKGPLENHLKLIVAGVRSGFSYCGAENITQLHKKAKFIQITSAGMIESGAHNVIIIEK